MANESELMQVRFEKEEKIKCQKVSSNNFLTLFLSSMHLSGSIQEIFCWWESAMTRKAGNISV